MSLSYATYENRNPEHRANFKAITDIPSSAVDTLKSVWVVDSGTTDHMNSNQTSFKTYRTFETAKAIYTGGGTIYAYGVGVIELFAKQKEGPPRKITLHNVLHVPSFTTNLISISALRQKGAYWRTDMLTLHLTADNQQFAQCREIGKLFALEEDNATRTASGGLTALVTMKTPPLLMDQAYRCFGHLGEANLRKLATIAEIEIFGILSPCEACILAKITKTIIRSPAARTMQIMDLFHNDLVGPITPMGYNKALYF